MQQCLGRALQAPHCCRTRPVLRRWHRDVSSGGPKSHCRTRCKFHATGALPRKELSHSGAIRSSSGVLMALIWLSCREPPVEAAAAGLVAAPLLLAECCAGLRATA